MIEDVRIRAARPDDAPAIAHVHVASWRTTYADLLPAAVLDRLDESRREQSWRERLLHPEPEVGIFVADDVTRGIVGFVSGGPERDGIAGYAGEMYALYLLESGQGRGTGRRLVGEIVRHLVRAGRVSMLVWVLAGNPASRFYERLGGTRVATKQDRRGEYLIDEIGYGWDDITHLAQ